MNINKIRNDFTILKTKIYNQPLVYLDNGATTHKPQVVIDAITDFYTNSNSNIHRGVHYLSDKATNMYEIARNTAKDFINAKHSHEIIFTSGTTGSVNMIAFAFGERYINEGDEVMITEMEHHSNIVPWQIMCERKKAILKVIPINNDGELISEEIDKLITDKTKLLSITHVSNSLGTINPIKEIIAKFHKHNIPVFVDGAQAIQHLKVDVQDLDCDFYAFSGHKIYGPTGIGILYGKEDILNNLPPYQGGGDMIERVTFDKTTYNRLPFKFEAGTPNIEGAIVLAVALNYVSEIGMDNIIQYEHDLMKYAFEKIKEIEGIKIYGNAREGNIISFTLDKIHFYDTGMILDKMGIAVRTGTHCTMPVMDKFNIDGTVRASFAMYNTKEDVDALCKGLRKVIQMFQ